ncbi:MAG: hypothetical protein K1X79_03140 [Oligoflexia bacterium]|nr:hypothetical protein [Oligoflexia bacterium]
MPIGYGANISAARVTRLANATSTALSRSYNQLASGLRINSASDDAAGLAVASTLNLKARVFNRGRMNIQDGISFLNTVDGVYSSSSGIIERMRELAEQSANGSLSSTQRNSLQSEFNKLREELYRLRDDTRFNNIQMLRGSGNTRGTSNLRQGSGEAYLSSDRKIFTYLSGTTLYQQNLDTGAVKQIATSVASFVVDDTGSRVGYGANSNVYSYDRLTGTSTTVFSAIAIDEYGLAISGDGSKLAIISDTAYTGAGIKYGASDGFSHLSVADLNTGTITGDNLTFTYSQIQSLSLSHNGNYVVLVAKDGAVGEIDAYSFRTNDLVNKSLNGGWGPSGASITSAQIDNSGALYVLSDANLVGENPNNVANIIKTTDGANYQNLTNLSTAGVSAYKLTDFGSSLTFATSENPAGQNPNPVLQLFKTSAGVLRQLTATTTGIGGTLGHISGDGFSLLQESGGYVQLVDARPEYQLQVSTGAGTSGVINSKAFALDAAAQGLLDLDISSQRGGRVALDVLASATSSLSLARADIGSALSRLGYAYNVSTSTQDGYESAKSRITDLDVAQGAAQATRLSILQNTQSAILAQASRLEPEIALSLLRNI